MGPKNRAIEWTERAYRRLLRLYPAAHRDRFGDLMAQHVRDLCRDAWDRRGVFGVVAVWGLLLRDVAGSLVVEHLSEGRSAVNKIVEKLGTSLQREEGARKLAGAMLGVLAQAALVISVLKLTSLPLTEGQLVIGLLCALAVSLQLTILGVLVTPARGRSSQGSLEG